MTSTFHTILVVDDEAAMREVLQARLEKWGFSVLLAETGRQAEALADQERPDIVISDVVLPDLSGLDLIQVLNLKIPDSPKVLITAHGTVDTAVEAMKFGALDFLTKPIDYSKLRATLAAAVKQLEGHTQVRDLERKLESGSGLGSLVGTSKEMQKAYETLRVLGDSDAPAFITGASGTGKELAARAVHELSARRDRPFVAINTAAIAEGITESELFGHERGAFTGATEPRPGYFEMADGGTLFLDEISEMPPSLQPKLLRVLEDGRVRRVGGRREEQVDVRVLAATNRDPDEARKSGVLRDDLYYRLSVFTVRMPLLAERPEDIPLLLQHFVGQSNQKHNAEVEGATKEAVGRLQAYDWPGNVRELRNVVERAVILSQRGWIDSVHLPPFFQAVEPLPAMGLRLPEDATVAQAERLLILHTLDKVGNNKTKAAGILGVDVKTIRNKLKVYGSDQADP
jgi:two-component system response regulator HydG